jgi:hypothetical protein
LFVHPRNKGISAVTIPICSIDSLDLKLCIGMQNKKSRPRKQRINQHGDQGNDEITLLLLKYVVDELNSVINQEMVRSESIESVQSDIDQKQLDISRLKERIAKIQSYIQNKRDHLRHLKDLKN